MESPLAAKPTVPVSHLDQLIGDALDKWNVARSAFATSLQTYLDAFSGLETVYPQILHSNMHNAKRLDVCATLDEELLPLVSYKKSIAAIEIRLLRLRTMSGSTSLISRLPTETLARVFILAVDLCRPLNASQFRQDPSIRQVGAISSVCSRWRHIALSTSQLWSRVDFEMLGNFDYARLWIERAGNRPLDIVKVDRSDRAGDCDAVFSLILPHTNHLRSMHLSSRIQTTENWILQWCNNGALRTLTRLALSAAGFREMIYFPVQVGAADQRRLDNLFHCLETLYLDSLLINWDLIQCHNLVTLSLIKSRISLSTLNRILLDNSRLQNIDLKLLEFGHGPTPSAAFPSIRLQHLQTLRLEDIRGHVICQILDMITPGNCGLALKIRHYYQEDSSNEFKNELLAFCRRSHLKSLHCSSFGMLQNVISAASGLETLALDHMAMSTPIYDLIVPPINEGIGSASNRALPHLPHLRTLSAKNCDFVNAEDFRRFISACSIREVGIFDCSIDNVKVSSIEAFASWAGLGVDVTFMSQEVEIVYAPFGYE